MRRLFLLLELAERLLNCVLMHRAYSIITSFPGSTSQLFTKELGSIEPGNEAKQYSMRLLNSQADCF